MVLCVPGAKYGKALPVGCAVCMRSRFGRFKNAEREKLASSPYLQSCRACVCVCVCVLVEVGNEEC